MIFHKEVSEGLSFGPGGKAAEGRTYETDYVKVALALLFVVLMAIAAFIGRWMAWPEAASAFLHLTEVSAGGVFGMFFGEKSALDRK